MQPATCLLHGMALTTCMASLMPHHIFAVPMRMLLQATSQQNLNDRPAAEVGCHAGRLGSRLQLTPGQRLQLVLHFQLSG